MSVINAEISPIKLKKARGKRPMKEVASAVGITRQHLWLIESGECTPGGDILARLCILYGVRIADLTRAETNGKKKAAA
jgi:transcriptional regulator with XRE-family HTH domain